MIETIKKFFDDFAFITMVMPVLIAGLPFLMLSVIDGVLVCGWIDGDKTNPVICIGIFFSAYIAREWGKKYEERMVRELGGMPTTIVLRFFDNKIDSISKLRYHKWFNDNLQGILLPLSLSEEQADSKSDEKYDSAIIFLRTYINQNRDGFPKVYRELKKYIFWRNLYGYKYIALLSCCVLGIKEFMMIGLTDWTEIFFILVSRHMVLGMLLIWIVLFYTIVTKKTVKRNAFDYAKALLETIDTLPQKLHKE